jgi:hypothetical protein
MVETVQPLIEQNAWTTGWVPDGDDSSKDNAALIDALNVLLDTTPIVAVTPTGVVHEVPSGGLLARKGFERLKVITSGSTLHGYYVRNIWPFRAAAANYLILAITDNTNVQFWAYNITANTIARMDSGAASFPNATDPFWGLGVDNVWYGGQRGRTMFSWDPAGPTWVDDASTNTTWKTLIDATNDSVTVATQYGRDFAFQGHEKVKYDGHVYTPARGIRYDKWVNDEGVYRPGDKVSRWAVWGATSGYNKSFKCILQHDPSAATTAPGTGATWKDYWTKVRLPLPDNTDGGETETSPSWYYMPTAAQTSVAAWHADRLFMRWDNQNKDRSRLLYSAPIKPDKGRDIPETVWDPTDFAPGNDAKGTGGGWRSFNDGTHHGWITALHSFGQYLIVFKRQAVWVLIGADDATWQNNRLMEGIGCVGPNAHCQVDGLVYFISDEGLYMTDGQSVVEASGNSKVRKFIRDRLDVSQPGHPEQDVVMWAFDRFIWMSLPSSTVSEKYVTLAYEVATGSFWKTNLPVLDIARYRDEGMSKLAFVPPKGYLETASDPQVYRYGAVDDDHDGTIAGAQTPIVWRARMAWWSFSTLRQQRRIRKVWALIKVVAQTVTIKGRKDYDDTTVKTTARVVSTAVPQHIEGEWFADSHAVSFEVSGTNAPAEVLGFAVETQPRRNRYHA